MDHNQTEVVLLCLTGMGIVIAGYFSLVFYRIVGPDSPFVPDLCRLDESTCQVVIRHPDARLLGQPNSVVGLFYYIIIGTGVAGAPSGAVPDEIVYVSWVGVAAAVYLSYSLLVRIKKHCALCLTAHVINILIAGLLTLQYFRVEM